VVHRCSEAASPYERISASFVSKLAHGIKPVAIISLCCVKFWWRLHPSIMNLKFKVNFVTSRTKESCTQPDAGLLSGGGYTLSGGFWAGGGVVVELDKIYLPIIRR